MSPLDAAKKLKEMQFKAWISLSEAFYAQTHDLSDEQQTILSTLQNYLKIPEDVVNKELDKVKNRPLVVQLSQAQQEFIYFLLSIIPLFQSVLFCFFRSETPLDRPVLEVTHNDGNDLGFTLSFIYSFYFSLLLY